MDHVLQKLIAANLVKKFPTKHVPPIPPYYEPVESSPPHALRLEDKL
jgi:hypothetical protein